LYVRERKPADDEIVNLLDPGSGSSSGTSRVPNLSAQAWDDFLPDPTRRPGLVEDVDRRTVLNVVGWNAWAWWSFNRDLHRTVGQRGCPPRLAGESYRNQQAGFDP